MDSFKGSLDAVAACRAVARGVEAACPTACCDIVPMADGGEGTLDVLLASVGGRRCSAMVHDPLMRSIRAQYGLLGVSDAEDAQDTELALHADGSRGVGNMGGDEGCATAAEPGRVAVVEMARASGLHYVDEQTRDPLRASTFGTGELIRHALDDGVRTIIVTLGGSATNDGGAGIAQALGARLLDANGRDLESGGAALARLDHIDTAHLDPRLADTVIRIATDVTNPLTGPTGASAVFGPQKGATPAIRDELEAGMAHYAQVVQDALGRDIASFPGAGAAGGLGAALGGVLGATLKSGIDAVLDAVDFDKKLDGVSLAVTGEGRIDGQSVRFGKVPVGVAKRCAARGIPTVAIVGGIGEGAEGLYELCESTIQTTVSGPMSLEKAMQDAPALYEQAADRLMRAIRIGMNLKG